MTFSRSILIIEDEPLIAMMLEDFLDSLGHKVVAQLRGPADIELFEDRSEGFRRAAATAGLVEVTIGEVAFDWQPTELEQFSSGMRGQDARLEDRSRIGAEERRLQKDLRRAERMGLDKEALEAELEKVAPRREPGE